MNAVNKKKYNSTLYSRLIILFLVKRFVYLVPHRDYLV